MRRSCEQALAAGVPAVAFTDHLDFTTGTDGDRIAVEHIEPRPYSRMHLLNVPGYLATVQECRQRYLDLRILTGAEIGEAHLWAASARTVVAGAGFDRILGSLHAIPFDGKLTAADYLFRRMPAGEVMRLYFAELLRLVEGSDIFQVLAHLDFPRRMWPRTAAAYDERAFEPEIRAVLQALAASGRVLEVNTKSPLASAELLRWWREAGGTAVSFGSDAHQYWRVGDRFKLAVDVVEAAGFAPAATASISGASSGPGGMASPQEQGGQEGWGEWHPPRSRGARRVGGNGIPPGAGGPGGLGGRHPQEQGGQGGLGGKVSPQEQGGQGGLGGKVSPQEQGGQGGLGGKVSPQEQGGQGGLGGKVSPQEQGGQGGLGGKVSPQEQGGSGGIFPPRVTASAAARTPERRRKGPGRRRQLSGPGVAEAGSHVVPAFIVGAALRCVRLLVIQGGPGQRDRPVLAVNGEAQLCVVGLAVADFGACLGGGRGTGPAGPASRKGRSAPSYGDWPSSSYLLATTHTSNTTATYDAAPPANTAGRRGNIRLNTVRSCFATICSVTGCGVLNAMGNEILVGNSYLSSR